MSLQIFKSQIPNQVLIDLFDKICVKTKEFYIINNISFKKGVYNNIIPDFLEICRKHYHISKKKYIDKTLTYNSFTLTENSSRKMNKSTLSYSCDKVSDFKCLRVVFFVTYLLLKPITQN